MESTFTGLRSGSLVLVRTEHRPRPLGQMMVSPRKNQSSILTSLMGSVPVAAQAWIFMTLINASRLRLIWFPGRNLLI